MNIKTPFLQKKLGEAYMIGFSKDVSDRSEQKRSELMDPRNVLSFHHGRKWESPANEFGDRSTEMTQHSTTTELHLKDVVLGDPTVTFRTAMTVSEQMHSSVMNMMISKFSDVTAQTGNVVNAAGRPFPEAFAEILEMLQPTLGDDGELQLPTMIIHPSQGPKLVAELERAGPDFERRIDELKARKKLEAEENEVARLNRFDRQEN